MPPLWNIRLLGGLRAEYGDQVLTRFKYQKVGGLLAYLAYYPRQMHAREVLVDLFWPESPPETARNNLSVALSSLRHQMEPPGIAPGTVLRADRYSLGLNPAAVRTDVQAFERALNAAGKVTRTTDRIQLLEQAVGLYDGPLLPGFYEAWIEPEQARLSGLFFDATSTLIGLLVERGEVAAALPYARRAVSLDVLREEAHEQLMRVLTRAGQPGSALRQYKELERLLEEELGVEPSAPLRALARQIERESGITGPVMSLAAPSRPPRSSGAESPAGSATRTFLAIDLESAMQEEPVDPANRSAREACHARLREEIVRHGGQEVPQAGDTFLVAFPSAGQALACALACRRALRPPEEARPEEGEPPDREEGVPPAVRMALHTGDVAVPEGVYQGPVRRHLSRMLTAGHGGQILCSEATAGLVRRELTERVRLVDLGVWRLRDLATPERLFQVDDPQRPTEVFPPLAAEAGHTPSLPLRITRFFGRNPEMARLVQALRPGGSGEADDREGSSVASTPTTRLVTLSGPAGTGKTRLAIEVADVLSDAYQGAVWFVPLADVVDPARIPDAVLDTLRIPRSPQHEPLEQVVDRLSAQPSLLVLDNYEHLVEGGTEVVQRLLERVAGLALLVTSRRRLDLSGEQEFPVPPLPIPAGDAVPADTERLSAYDSVRLFVDRAQAAMPHFQVTSHNAPAVAELCCRLEGIPLAIELAAARAQVLTPAQMLRQIEHRFGFLVSHRRDASARHRSLQAAIDWSYRLLSPELQRFFGRLSVFRGGWTVEAAEAVCEEPLALDYLALLREDSLVLAEETTAGMRFRMLETLRDYAEKHLLAQERTAVRKRHLEFFLALAEGTEPKTHGPEQATWLYRLETEHDNLRSALEGVTANGEADPSALALALRLSGALQRFWSVRGYLSEGLVWYRTILGADRTGERTKERAKALNAAGTLALLQGNHVTAQPYHEESLVIFQEIGERRGAAVCLGNLGIVAEREGNYPAARSRFQESLDIVRELDDKQSIAYLLGNLGVLAERQGDLRAARDYYEESLAIHRALGERRGIAIALSSLGIVVERQGDLTAARSCQEESLALYRDMGDRRGIATALRNLGVIEHNKGDYVSARAQCEECMRIYREIGDRWGTANTLYSLGQVAEREGEYATARSLFHQSLAIARELDDKHSISYSLGSLGVVAERQGDLRAARNYYKESLVIHHGLGDRLGTAYSLEEFASLAAAQGQPERAVRLYGAAEMLREKLGVPLPAYARDENARQVAETREAMGEEAFAAAWKAGRAMTMDEAVAYALEEVT